MPRRTPSLRPAVLRLLSGPLFLATRLGALSLILALADPARAGETADSAAAIVAQWKAAAATYQAAEIVIEWRETELRAPALHFGKDQRPRDGNGRPIVSDSVRSELICRFLSDGKRWRHSESGPLWDNAFERTVAKTRSWLRDGEFYRFLDDIDGGEPQTHDTGYIHAAARGDIQATSPDLTMYFLLVTPFDEPFGRLAASKWQVAAEVAETTLGPHRCYLLTFTEKQSNLESRVWLTTDGSALPLRYTIGGRVDIDFTYGASASRLAHPPTGWTCTIKAPDLTSVDRVAEATVTKWELRDRPGPGEFDLVFPPGTIVWDYVHKVGDQPQNYLLKADGTRRPITVEERIREVDYETLQSTAPHDFSPPPGAGRRLAAVYLVNAGCLLALVLLFLRFRSRGRDQ